MGFRFRKRIKILAFVYLNISRKGISSLSIGKKGFKINLGRKGKKSFSIGIPGTGFSFSKRLGRKK